MISFYIYKYIHHCTLTNKVYYSSHENLVRIKLKSEFRIRFTNCVIYNIIKHGRWQTTCTSATSSATTCPPVQPPAPPIQLTVPLAQPIAPPTQPIQPAPMPQLNWSHFKLEFTGKLHKDAEHTFLGPMTGWICMFPRRCQSPAFLSNTSRKGKVMV